jgi:hypothetical protein
MGGSQRLDMLLSSLLQPNGASEWIPLQGATSFGGMSRLAKPFFARIVET